MQAVRLHLLSNPTELPWGPQKAMWNTERNTAIQWHAATHAHTHTHTCRNRLFRDPFDEHTRCSLFVCRAFAVWRTRSLLISWVYLHSLSGLSWSCFSQSINFPLMTYDLPLVTRLSIFLCHNIAILDTARRGIACQDHLWSLIRKLGLRNSPFEIADWKALNRRRMCRT